MNRLILKSFQSPGDIVMLTAAVRDLHTAHPGRFQTDVRTSADAMWENNPHLTRLDEHDREVASLDMHYPLIHQSNERPYHFLHGYTQYLEQQLDLRIPVTQFRGDIHLSASEKSLPPLESGVAIPEQFWIVVAGGKYDFTAKWWNPASYQAVVDHFRDRIPFVQCGEQGHWHPRLRGAVDLVGKTSLRELIRLMYHAEGVVCPVTLAMHLAAAVESKSTGRYGRPCVVIAGGREPAHWEAYPNHQFISTNGTLACCQDGGCWKSRCQLVGDGDAKDRRELCDQPVQLTPELRIAKCMDMITPDEVIRRIELYYAGGLHSYGGDGGERRGKIQSEPDQKRELHQHKPNGTARKDTEMAPKIAARPQDASETETPANEPAHLPVKPTPKQDVLLKFRHGLGDAVQLTVILQHLQHYRPEWNVDVASLPGKHSIYAGLCRDRMLLNGRPLPADRHDQTFDLDWEECVTCYADSPSTKAERCLREVFQLQPIPELCRYVMQPRDKAVQKAHRYLQQVCRVAAGSNGRYPVALLHYEGNTSAEYKDLPHGTAGHLCDTVIASGLVPVILDWDGRSPLPDGKRIYNPHTSLELWGGLGTGDAEVLAALIELSSLMIGVDSGPLHIAGATDTPTIGVWTRHHPLHYFGHADNVVHLVPRDHRQLLRGDADVGDSYFQRHYRHYPYDELERELLESVKEHLRDPSGGLVYTRSFWVRANNAKQDLVVVEDIAENDSYRIDDLPMPQPVIVDVGAHIGCFTSAVHRRNPLARIIAVECCPENLAALRKNANGIATVIQGAVTYENDVALLNAVFPDCETTGGSRVVSRAQLAKLREQEGIGREPQDEATEQYWIDERAVMTLTLEQIFERHGIDRIHVLKLDCEGSEFSILESSTSLDRIDLIVGEYHGKQRFHQLVSDKFADWKLRILKDGELGTFWLENPSSKTTIPATPRHREPKHSSPWIYLCTARHTGTHFLRMFLELHPQVSFWKCGRTEVDGRTMDEWHQPLSRRLGGHAEPPGSAAGKRAGDHFRGRCIRRGAGPG